MKIWTTRDGTQIPITEMTDAHLSNTIKFLVEKYDVTLAESYSAAMGCSGEMANYYALQACDDVQPSPWIAVLRAEQDRRKKGKEIAET